MKINKLILETFDKYHIYKPDGICYLLSLHYEYEPSYIPEDFKQKVHTTGIVQNENGSITWKVPLFEGQEVAFKWVETEYVVLFKKANPKKGGKVRESIKRMKKLFADNPDIRKDDVLGATQLYLNNTDSEYIRFPHYFIEKGTGVDKTNDILDWIDKHRIREQYNQSTDLTNQLQ